MKVEVPRFPLTIEKFRERTTENVLNLLERISINGSGFSETAGEGKHYRSNSGKFLGRGALMVVRGQLVGGGSYHYSIKGEKKIR